jgi:hygromycin-B 7''-O-kinase
VKGIVDVENAVAADPLLDLAKTDCYSIRGDLAKRRGLTDGYGELGPSSDVRLDLYRLYHALDLYTWFASQGEQGPLASIRDDLRTNTRALTRL